MAVTTFEECKECKNHWFNGIELEMCDNDWNCLEHEELHLNKEPIDGDTLKIVK